MNLYEISEKYREAILAISEMEPEEMTDEDQQQRISKALGDIEDSFQNKALAIGKYISQESFSAEALKTVELRIQQRRKSAEKRVTWLTEYLRSNMEHLGFGDISDPEIKLKLKRLPPKVILEDESIIPESFKESKIEVLIRRAQIMDALKSGTAVPGAFLRTDGNRLEIR
jgi:hypothetical protein